MNEPIRKRPPTTGHRGSIRLLALFGAVLFVGLALYAAREMPTAPATAAADDKPAGPTDSAVAAANKFLDALSSTQRKTALYEFASDLKSRWSNFPVIHVPRNGVRLGDLTKTQRTLAMEVVAAVTSKDGYQKVVNIMDGDQQLAEGKGGDEGRRGPAPRGTLFGRDLYYLAIFGKPSETKPWMVQFGGHHLGLNVTVIGKHFVLTPTHTDAQPALYQRDGKNVRPLGLENDTAFKLVNSLDEKQLGQAVISDRAQGELILGPGQDNREVPSPEEIKGSDLSREQQAMLLDVIAAWVKIVEPEVARARLAEIQSKIGDTYFAWEGPTTPGRAAYFRVQGPTVWIEYAPQGGTDHIHTVIRNPKDDYGKALLKG